jgi:hypothetical protein
LSEILKVVQFNGAIFFNAHFTAPWCIASPAETSLAQTLGLGEERVLLYRYMVDSSCLVDLVIFFVDELFAHWCFDGFSVYWRLNGIEVRLPVLADCPGAPNETPASVGSKSFSARGRVLRPDADIKFQRLFERVAYREWRVVAVSLQPLVGFAQIPESQRCGRSRLRGTTRARRKGQLLVAIRHSVVHSTRTLWVAKRYSVTSRPRPLAGLSATGQS